MPSPEPEPAAAAFRPRWSLYMAALYAAGGLAGSLLAIPPGYSSAIWLPAGIALMGLVAWGWRLWPGILLGSFLINLFISVKAVGYAGPWTDWLRFAPLALGIAAGATLQALAGAWLVRRYVGYPTGCHQPRETLLFLGLGGPASCLISASSGILLLAATRTIPPGNVPFAWFNWYVGDTLGVLIVAPLFLVLLGEPAAAWRQRRLQVGLPMLVSLLGVVGTFALLGRQEDQRIRTLFEHRMVELTHRIQTSLNEHLTILGLARAHFDASPTVDRKGFDTFTREVLGQHPTFQALEWVPKVPGSARAAFEAAARKDGPALGAFRILERSPEGEMRPAPDREVYYPVRYLAPFQGNEKAAGFDLASEPRRRDAMARAVRSGGPAATDGVVLAQERGHQAGVLVFLPVFRPGAPLDKLPQREAALQGFVLGVFRVDDLIDRALAGFDRNLVRFQVQEASGGILHAALKTGGKAAVLPPFRLDGSLRLADKAWRLDLEPTLDFLDANRSPLPWLVQAVGLFLTGVLGLFLLEMSIHKEALAEREAQAAKAESQAQLAGIINAATEFAIIATDLEGTVRLFSPGAERMLGYAAEEVVGQAAPERFHLGSEVASRGEALSFEAGVAVGGFEVFVHRPRQGVAEALEWTFVRKDGRTLPVQLVVTAILDPEGRPTGFLGIAHDISERRRIEEERRQNAEERLQLEQKFQQAQKMESLGVLAGGVAHDMNNVLGAILGLATANLGMVAPASPVQRGLETIIQAVRRGSSMVQGLLGFARQNPVEDKRVDLNALLREDSRLLERTTFSKVQLMLELEPGLRPIQGDAGALAHAFMNLSVNAVDAMPEKGTLTIRTRNLGEDQVEVQIQDTGCGMTEAVRAKALEPFFTTKEVGKGTGLGLSMVYSTVKAHQGELELQSEPGRGTCVTIRFPAALPGEAKLDTVAASAPVPAAGSLDVLLVDDDEMMQFSTEAILETLGHTIAVAGTGEEALRRLEAGLRPQVVILDMNMPGLSGAETLPLLRALCPEVPVLLATGRTDQKALDLVEAYPGVTLMAKPYTMEDLSSHLQRAARP